MGNTAMRLALKSAFIATAILVSASITLAETAKPPKQVVQILPYKRIDPATYELSFKLEDGTTIELRMSTFTAQDLSRQLGNFSR
jgi:hypothetical protein